MTLGRLAKSFAIAIVSMTTTFGVEAPNTGSRTSQTHDDREYVVIESTEQLFEWYLKSFHEERYKDDQETYRVCSEWARLIPWPPAVDFVMPTCQIDPSKINAGYASERAHWAVINVYRHEQTSLATILQRNRPIQETYSQWNRVASDDQSVDFAGTLLP